MREGGFLRLADAGVGFGGVVEGMGFDIAVVI